MKFVIIDEKYNYRNAGDYIIKRMKLHRLQNLIVVGKS